MNNFEQLLDKIVKISESGQKCQPDLLEEFLNALESGEITCAKQVAGLWQVDPRVKIAILLAFRMGENKMVSVGPFNFIDKDNLWPRKLILDDKVRIVPGGASIRRGACLGQGVTIMPPSYVNIGANIGDGSMLDSNALVGSCAQVGRRVHISAGVQIGGVLEPVSALPVIIEDNCLIGGNSGIYEGTIVGQGAIIGAGVILTKSTRVFDLVNEKILEAENGSLKIPQNAVVIPGSRAINNGFGLQHKLSISTPLIIKYSDDKTREKTKLEDLLR